MARPKRVPYRPDGFQALGRVVTAWVLDRGTLIAIGLGALAVVFIVVAVLVRVRANAEEEAWTALYRAGNDVAALEAALSAYGSTSARPFVLAAFARSLMEPPRDESGKPKDEPPADRERRLRRAENALRELADDYPAHRMRLYGLTMLARILEEEGRHMDAISVLREALKADPGTLEPMIRCDIGRNYFLAGSPGEARPFLERATELSTRKLAYQERWGAVPQEVSPVWRENAEYLLAKVGRPERKVEIPKPLAPPSSQGRAPAEGGASASPQDSLAGSGLAPGSAPPTAESQAQRGSGSAGPGENKPQTPLPAASGAAEAGSGAGAAAPSAGPAGKD